MNGSSTALLCNMDTYINSYFIRNLFYLGPDGGDEGVHPLQKIQPGDGVIELPSLVAYIMMVIVSLCCYSCYKLCLT